MDTGTCGICQQGGGGGGWKRGERAARERLVRAKRGNEGAEEDRRLGGGRGRGRGGASEREEEGGKGGGRLLTFWQGLTFDMLMAVRWVRLHGGYIKKVVGVGSCWDGPGRREEGGLLSEARVGEGGEVRGRKEKKEGGGGVQEWSARRKDGREAGAGETLERGKGKQGEGRGGDAGF